MRYLLLVLFCFSGFGLVADTLRNKTFTKPLVLKAEKNWVVENCRFESVEGMPCLKISGASEIMIKGCDFQITKTNSSGIKVLNNQAELSINGCNFSGPSNANFTTSSGNVGIDLEYRRGYLRIEDNTFTNLNQGLWLTGIGMDDIGVTGFIYRFLGLNRNRFTENHQAIRFGVGIKPNWSAGVEMKCNTFTTPASPAPFTARYGIWVESGVEMPDIGNDGLVGRPKPSANWWPVAGTTDLGDPNANPPIWPNWPIRLNSGLGIEGWFSPTGWESVHTLTESGWKYYAYKNEFVGSWVDLSSNQGFEFPPVNRIVRSWSEQVIPTGVLFDDACFNFGQVMVFPTRPAHSQDSSLTSENKFTGKTEGYLDQNVPNPAGNSTAIGYRLPTGAKAAKFELFEISTGRIVKSVGIPISGHGQVELGLHGLPDGIYGYRLLSGVKPLGWKKMIIAR